MTRPSTKEEERRYLDSFLTSILDGAAVEEEGEKPDFWVKCCDGCRIAIELTKYHPSTQPGQAYPRVQVESLWWKELWPRIDSERRQNGALARIHVFLIFKTLNLPSSAEHKDFAHDCVDLISDYAKQLSGADDEIKLFFMLARDVPNWMSPKGDRWRPIAIEQWPMLNEYLNEIRVSFCPIEWHYWSTTLESSWNAPCPEEFRRILEKKQRDAKKYVLSACPLWLVVVCNILPDLSSHIHPSSVEDRTNLLQCVTDCGFDFGASPFAQVWLFSAPSGDKMRIYPVFDKK